MTHFRVRWEKRGEHIHARLFSRSLHQATYAKNGDLCFSDYEWASFLRCFDDHGADRVTIVPEDGEP